MSPAASSAGVQSTAAGVQSIPAGVRSTAADVQSFPAGVRSTAADVQSLPAGVRSTATDVQSLLRSSPFSIIENRGQWTARSDAGRLLGISTARNGARLFFFERGISIVHYVRSGDPPGGTLTGELAVMSGLGAYRVDLRFDGAGHPRVDFTEPADGLRHYYNPSVPQGAEDVRAWKRVTYHGLYPGIDFTCALEDGGMKYAFALAPGSDPSAIRMRWTGADPDRGPAGGMLLRHAAGEIRDGAPYAFQPADGGAVQPRDVRWMPGDGTLGFRVSSWDRARPLIIDPFLQWSTFIGGALSEYARDVALGGDGSMYICGYSAGTDFPVTPGAMQNVSRGNFEIFLTAFSRDRRLMWSTYFGGSGSEENPQIAVSGDGLLYATGSTSSTDLPVTAGAQQERNGGRYDAFLLALDTTGARRWATYFGGSYTDESADITVTESGLVCITGGTYSTNFPVTPDAQQTSNAGDYDAFIARFSSRGTCDWATYIGGWSMDFASGIAADPSGDLLISGRTESTNLPAVGQGRQSSYGGGPFDAFVVRLSGKTRKILWSSYLGGEAEDNAERIAVGPDGQIVVAGYTSSRHFPVTGGSLQKRPAGLIDGFITSLDRDGALRWSTCLGGGEVEKITGLSVDPFGNIIVAGFTGSDDFPLAGNPVQSEKSGGYDLFLSEFAPDGSYLWGTFFGGESHDISYGLGTDGKGNAVVVGGTESRGFRTAGNVYQGDLAGLTDAFVLRLIFNAPMASAGRDTTICFGGRTVLAGRGVGGQPPYQYSWEPSMGLSDMRVARPEATPTVSTNYVLTVTDTEGAVAHDTVRVTVASLAVVDAGEDQYLCPGAVAALNVSVRGGRGPYTFHWTPEAGLSDPASANPTANPASTTRYVVTVTDALGCVSRDSVLVRVHPNLAVDAGEELFSCAGAPISLQAVVRGGTAPFTYRWQPAAGLDNPSAASPVLMPQGSTRIVVTVTDVNGCSGSDTVRITVHQPPQVDAGGDLALCAGETGTLSARVSGGKKPYSYAWTPGDGLSSAAVLTPGIRPERTGRYVLTVTDANGCVVRDSVLVRVHPQPALRFAAEADVCGGSGIAVGAEATGGTPPYRYRWSPAAGLSDPAAAVPTAAPTRSTTYTLSVTDANGCGAEGTVRVTVRPAPDVTLRDRHRVCLGSSVELAASVRGGTPPYTYAWTPAVGLSAANVPDPVSTPPAPITYTLRVTDAIGCVVEKRVDVEVLPPPVVDAGEDITLCEGGNVVLDARVTGGKSPYRAVWSPSLGLSSTSRLDPTVRTSSSRMYTVAVTDANGCTVTDSVFVRVAPPPVVNAGADLRICEGYATPIEAAVSGGTPPYRYSWSPAAGLFDPLAQRPNARPEKTTTYTLTVTDALGCTGSDEVTVAVAPAPRIVTAREVTICRDQGRRLEVAVRGGRGPYTYAWTPMQGLSAGDIAEPDANPIQTTTYTLTVTDANGCTANTTITVTVLPCNKADAGDDTEMCLGGELRLGPAAVDTMFGARYSWAPATGLTGANAPQPLARPRESTRYVLTKRNRFGCVSTDTVFVRVRPVPEVDAGRDLTLCPGESGTLSAAVRGGTPPYRYAWRPPLAMDAADAKTVHVRPARSMRYVLAVTDAHACTVEDSVLVHVPDPLRMEMPRSVSLCQGERVRIGGTASGGTPPYTFFWSPARGLSDRTIAVPDAAPVASTQYALTLTDANGCARVDTVDVSVLPAPVAEITAEGRTTFCEGGSVRLRAPAGFASYAWSSGEQTREIVVREKGQYVVTVTDARGCSSASDPVPVDVAPLPEPRIAALGPRSFCAGDSVILDAGKGFVSYAWSTGAVTRRITVKEEGSYRVEVTTAAGCTAVSQEVTVEVRPVPVASVRRSMDTLVASPAEHYQWLRGGAPIPGATGRIHVARRSGAYALQTRNDAGCTAESDPMKLSFGSAAIAPPRLTARRGDTVSIALRIVSSADMSAAGSGAIEADLAVKKKTLRVISGGRILSEEQEEQHIRISGRYRRGQTSLAVLRAEVLGERGEYPLVLKNVRWLDGLVRTELRDGILTIRD